MRKQPRFVGGLGLAALVTVALALPACRGRRLHTGSTYAGPQPVVVASPAPRPAPVLVVPGPGPRLAPPVVVPARPGVVGMPAPAPIPAPLPEPVPAPAPDETASTEPAGEPASEPADGPAEEPAGEPTASTPSEEPPPEDAPPADEPAPMPEEAPVAAEPPFPPPPVDPGADAARFGSEAARQSEVERDRARFLAQRNLEAARSAIARRDYAEAESLLLAAREADPTNRDVANELRQVQELLARPGAAPGGALEDLRRRQEILVDEQRTSAQRFYGTGRTHLQRGRYDQAIQDLEQALFIINSSPFPIDWRNLKRDVEIALDEARRGKVAAMRAAREEQTERALVDLAAAEEQRLLEEQARLEGLMGAAVDALNRDEYDRAERYADMILELQPDNPMARDLKATAGAAAHDRALAEHIVKEKQAFREWMDDMEATRVLEHRILKWPSQSFWDRITRVRAASRTSFAAEIRTNPAEVALTQRLRTTTVNVNIENRPFREIVQTLQIQTGVNIVVDPRIQADVGDAVVTGIAGENLALSTVLDWLQTSTGVEGVVWTVKGNVVLFTKSEFVVRNLVNQSHSVADLTVGLTNFLPPRVDIVSADQVNDEERPLFGAEGEEPIKPYGTVDELMELIKTAVGTTGTWEVEGVSIAPQGSNVLVVKHTPEIQTAVARFLDDLRLFSGVIVTVETRFLTVSDHFLRDVGVDFRGLGGLTPGTLANLDDVTNGFDDGASAGRDNNGAGLPAGAALHPSSGAYFNDGSDGDFRARTENIFTRSLGTVLSSLGGATFTFGFLDDSEFSMILRAVEKTQTGRLLTAPTITVYNTQRANLTVVNQLSYIQDFDVEVAQTSFIADPIVGIIQDGLTLDVRPTVSNDRKYITLELQPTVARLLEPIPTFSTSLASTAAPVIIQLPELRIQQARTTVKIPDGGSILIGGLKNITTVDRQSETPFLAKVPILSFLFSRKGRSDEMSNLMILVRATITDLKEEEARMMGRGLR